MRVENKREKWEWKSGKGKSERGKSGKGKGWRGNNGKGKMCEKKRWGRENLRKHNVKVEK